MPIDEDQLTKDIQTAQTEHQKASLKESESRHVLRNFSSIVMIETKIPNNSGGFDIVKELPQDTQIIGKKMTVVRRQEIYTENKKKLDALIASG